MKAFQVDELKEFKASGFNRIDLAVTDNFKLLMISFKPGQAVPPCVMERHTAFYIIEGRGKVIASAREELVREGSIVLIEPGLSRQIIADTHLVVLAMQYH